MQLRLTRKRDLNDRKNPPSCAESHAPHANMGERCPVADTADAGAGTKSDKKMCQQSWCQLN